MINWRVFLDLFDKKTTYVFTTKENLHYKYVPIKNPRHKKKFP